MKTEEALRLRRLPLLFHDGNQMADQKGLFSSIRIRQIFEETRNDKAIQIAKNLIAKRQMLLEMFAQATEVPLEKIKNLALIKAE
jgi:hypothetical protein